MPGIGTIKLYRTVLWRLSVLQFCRFSFCQVILAQKPLKLSTCFPTAELQTLRYHNKTSCHCKKVSIAFQINNFIIYPNTFRGMDE